MKATRCINKLPPVHAHINGKGRKETVLQVLLWVKGTHPSLKTAGIRALNRHLPQRSFWVSASRGDVQHLIMFDVLGKRWVVPGYFENLCHENKGQQQNISDLRADSLQFWWEVGHSVLSTSNLKLP